MQWKVILLLVLCSGAVQMAKAAAERARPRPSRSPEAAAARALYAYERRRFHRPRGKGLIKEKFVRTQLKRWDHSSVLSGRTSHLRLRRFWPDLELSEWNCVVVTARENQSLAHCHDWLARFPPSVVSLMQMHRDLDAVDEMVERRGQR